MFKGSDTLEVLIFEEGIEIRGYCKVVKFGLKRKQLIACAKMSNEVLEQVVGSENLFETAGVHNVGSSLEHNNIKLSLGHPLNVVSLFSGCGAMDYGFKRAGFELKFALELEQDMCETYRSNLGDHIVCADICKYDMVDIPDAQIVLGGSPCQDYSNANFSVHGSDCKILNSPKNKLVRKFVEVVKHTKSCLVAVLENVPQILTKGKRFIEELKEALCDFDVTTHKFNAVNFGSAQKRERAIIVASKIGPIHLTQPHTEINTVRNAFEGLYDDIANQRDYTVPKATTIRKMEYVGQGENYLAIPEALRPSSVQSNMYRRLEWDSPSPTIVNVRKSQLLHPEYNRTLTIRECCRLFDLPDTYVLKGSLNSKQQMIANAVPVRMMEEIARQIKEAILRYMSRGVLV